MLAKTMVPEGCTARILGGVQGRVDLYVHLYSKYGVVGDQGGGHCVIALTVHWILINCIAEYIYVWGDHVCATILCELQGRS